MPVTEAEAVAALPRQGWIYRYVKYAVQQTTAPLIYHLGTGITTMAVTAPIFYGMKFAGKLRANIYTMLVGRSGEEQKSTALNIGRDILFGANPKLVGDYPGSPEGLAESLSIMPSQLIPISEFGKFLSSAQRGYFEPTKSLLADIWDAQSFNRAKAKRQVISVKDPRLSIVAACSIPYLEKYTLSEDWTGGFMGRWLVFYGRRERTEANPEGDETDLPWLIDDIKRRAAQTTFGACLGLDPQALAMWTQWFDDIANRELPSNVIGIRARAPTMARKIALIYGWDYGPAQAGQPWYMGVDVLEPAIKLAELHVKSLVDLSEVIAEHEDARIRRAVLAALSEKGGTATLGELLSILKRRKRVVVETLDSLLEEKKVERMKTTLGDGITYVLTEVK